MPQYPFNNSMDGGMFGPQGGLQNTRGGLGGGQMSDREFQLILEGLRSQSPTGGALPNYDSPAPAGGPPAPQGVPGLGTTGIDPSMMASGSGGGLGGMEFGTQAVDEGVGSMQDAMMGIARQREDDERIRKLLAEAGMGGGGNVPVRPPTAGWLASPTSGHGMGGGYQGQMTPSGDIANMGVWR